MTIHIKKDEHCSNCGERFFPFPDDRITCPYCNYPSSSGRNMSLEFYNSIRYNLEHYRSYLPHSWLSCSFSDQVLLIVMNLFTMSYERGIENIKQFIKFSYGTIMSVDITGADEHKSQILKEHIWELAINIYERLEAGQLRPTYNNFDEYL